MGVPSSRGESTIDAKNCSTYLQGTTVLRTDDGYEADLQAVFLLQHCVELFNRCWSKIAQRYNFTTKSSSAPRSILVDLFDVEKLMEDRSESQEKANLLEIFDKDTKRRRSGQAGTANKRANQQTETLNRRGGSKESWNKKRKSR